MKTRIPILVSAALAALFLSSCKKAPPKAAKAGDLDVKLAIDPDPPTTGDNRLQVTLHDQSGQPLEGAHLSFEYDMPAMGSMPEMKGGGDVTPEGGGRYAITYPLSMLGDWSLTLGIEAPGHPHATVKLKVSPPHRGFTVLGRSGAAAQGSAGAQALEVPPERQQRIGVTFAPVEERPLRVTLRAAGRVEVDERKLADVTLKYEAYVQKLFVGETGKPVKEGQPLLVLYSPDLLAAEAELLTARKSGAAPEIIEATDRRLALWGLTRAQIAGLERQGTADGKVALFAPVSGVVLEKSVVEGAHVMPGNNLYRIGNLGRVWVQAAVYERDAPLLSVGQSATVSLPSLPGDALEARVTFVAPTVEEKTRTLAARLELLNPQLLLKPGMFADVVIEVPLGTRLAVPDSAVLMSGEHRYVFLDRGEGKLEPVEVSLGVLAGEFDEVKAGLKKGDRVATAATFLLSSEARLRDALPRWRTP